MGTFPPVRRKKLSETGKERTVLTTPLYTAPPTALYASCVRDTTPPMHWKTCQKGFDKVKNL